MFDSRKRWIVALLLGLYLYYLLPATAVLFYELYHLTGIAPINSTYSAFKAGGYYFGVWEYQLVTCVLVTLLVGVVPALFKRGKHNEQT